jgi:hypothetical protein
MKWTLVQGDRVKYRPLGEDHDSWGRVHKEVDILTERLELLRVHVVRPDDDTDLILLGDGEILERQHIAE